MSAEKLRRAAALMRERAQAATPGRWAAEPETAAGRVWVRMDWRSDLAPVTLPPHGIAIQRGDIAKRRMFEIRSRRESGWQDTQESVYQQREADALHIASWHPDIALAVADLVSMAADHMEGAGYPCSSCVDKTLMLARAYLGEGVTSP